MITLAVEQGSPEWIAARIGIPTASQFHRIITPKTMRLSDSAKGYLCELLAEWMLGAALDPFVSEWMERGTGMEEAAVDYYELQRGQDTEKVGFLMRDDRLVGCSPDRLVGDDGGLEIKCPSAAVHVSHLLDMPSKFTPQVQGAMWITGRKWWDLLSYHPELPPALVRIERDDAFISTLAKAVDGFLDILKHSRTLMIERGYVTGATEEAA